VRVLVTGGAGFLGASLVERLLAEGHQVDVVDDLSGGSLANLAAARAQHRRALSFHQLDVRAAELVPLLRRRRPEVVFHLAGRRDAAGSVADPLGNAEVHVVGTLRVLEAAVASGTGRVVMALDGGALYGEPGPEDLPVRESSPRRPLVPLGVAQLAALEYLRWYREAHDLEFCALALANVYGPRLAPGERRGVITCFAQQLAVGQPLVVHGDGQQTRDFLYVDDAVDALVRAMERGGGLVLHVGTGRETSVLEVARLLGELAGVVPEIRFGPPRPGDLRRSALDPGRAALHLGWRPWTGLAEGLAAVLAAAMARRPGALEGPPLSGRDPRPGGGPPRRAPRTSGARPG